MADKGDNTGDLKIITKDEVARHKSKTDLWMILHNKVYDVTQYIEEHPGGVPILVESAGQDGTEAFEDIGHSTDAREIMEKYLIGKVPDEERTETSVNREPEVVPKSVHVAYEGSSDDQGPLRSIRTVFMGLLFTTPFVLLVTWYIRTLQRLRSATGFWKGIGISSLASISLTAAVTAWLRKYSKGAKNTSYPAHYKPEVTVSKRRNVSAGVLNPREFHSFPLAEKYKVSSDTYKYVFSLPKPDSILGLPTGQHVYIRHENNEGKMVSRSYTPTSSNTDRGRMELVVKTYEKGFMSQYLKNLKINEKADFWGPGGKMKYSRYLAKEIGMIAGGTGITPMFSIIKAVCMNDKDDTKISLLYANKTEEDILLREELDRYAKEHPDKFKVWYVLGSAPEGWEYGTGHIDKEMAKNQLPAPNGDESKILLCGPPGLQTAMTDSLVELGFHRPSAIARITDEIFIF
ncbi:hypothetical protein N7448_003703 [Penicillium atrosanguineum]|nr:hypothetical protein N7526_009506 [Penicillium atrosanguineum]KAJ5140295.1 hypothetical protein N7448_003703 [Penicillium atrosanguineum]